MVTHKKTVTKVVMDLILTNKKNLKKDLYVTHFL